MVGVKGQVETDLIIFLVIIFVMAILAFVVVKSWNGIDSGIQTKASLTGAPATASSNAGSGFASGFNAGFVVAMTILYIGLFITSRNIGTNPMFFFINVFVLVIALTLAAILGNVFDSATNTTNFVVERASMPAIVYIGNHFLEFAIGGAAMILIGLLAKPGDANGQ